MGLFQGLEVLNPLVHRPCLLLRPRASSEATAAALHYPVALATTYCSQTCPVPPPSVLLRGGHQVQSEERCPQGAEGGPGLAELLQRILLAWRLFEQEKMGGARSRGLLTDGKKLLSLSVWPAFFCTHVQNWEAAFVFFVSLCMRGPLDKGSRGLLAVLGLSLSRMWASHWRISQHAKFLLVSCL